MFKFRKQNNFIYEDFVNEMTRQVRYYNLSQFDKDVLGGKRRTIIDYNLSDVNKILKSTAIDTRQLLLDKGFSISIHDRVDKSVLLNTEISELADAVKKGLGSDAEGLELADIVIRASNFLCLNETHCEYIKLCNLITKDVEHTIEKISVTVTMPAVDDEDNKISSKYYLIEEMMVSWIDIKRASEMLEVCFINDLDYQKVLSSFILLWNKVIDLTTYCKCYATLYLPENLQFYIDAKMDKNFKRPYKYGVCKEHK